MFTVQIQMGKKKREKKIFFDCISMSIDVAQQIFRFFFTTGCSHMNSIFLVVISPVYAQKKSHMHETGFRSKYLIF